MSRILRVTPAVQEIFDVEKDRAVSLTMIRGIIHNILQLFFNVARKFPWYNVNAVLSQEVGEYGQDYQD
jgi:hypothetical protein